MSKIFAIYPTDNQQSTKFLNKINTYLKRNLNENWHCYKVKFTDLDHKRSVEESLKFSTKFILFMGHGRSDTLYGSCANESNDFVSSEAMESNFQFYKNERFITSANIELFKNKIFFSFSCNSNVNNSKALGRIAIDKGILAFVGFGDIPTDYNKDLNFSKKGIEIFKGLITKIIKESLFFSVENNYSVEKLVDLIKLLTLKEIQILILSKKCYRNKNEIVKNLYLFKNEIVIFGNRFEKII